MPIKILIGGSPCQHWSISQKNNRETEPEGIGWELFKNYIIAKEKFKPDFFLYENNKSAAQPIKDQISRELETPLQYINSALVSAQNRQRFYAHNIPNVPQPEDRGILLRDILESGVVDREKAYCLKHQAGNSRDYFKKHHTQIAFEPVGIEYNPLHSCDVVITDKNMRCQYKNGRGTAMGYSVYFDDVKAPAVIAGQASRMKVIEPIRIGTDGMITVAEPLVPYVQNKLPQLYEDREEGAKTGLYAVPNGEIPTPYIQRKMSEMVNKYGYLPDKFCAYNSKEITDKSPTMATMSNRQGGSGSVVVIQATNNTQQPIYEVRNGLITIKDKQYPIKLFDGFYIIRKLTVTECCRLQTLPDDYCRAVSATQGYKGLGNGWTAEVIIHILKHMNIPLDEEIEVLSMYDGIGTGRYCFDKMGYKNVKYYAYEIDKYAMQVAMSNYDDIIQCGDAFQVRNEDWRLI